MVGIVTFRQTASLTFLEWISSSFSCIVADADLFSCKKIKIYSTNEKKEVENPGIDPGTSRMLSERSTM